MFTRVNYEDVYNNKGFYYQYRHFKLCYVETSPGKEYNEDTYEYEPYDDDCHHMLFYFTPLELNEQWGDDWDDVPYEHNAGEPYDTHENDLGEYVQHTILIVDIPMPAYIRGSLQYMNEPRDYGFNSPFSVEMINAKAVAWLYIDDNEFGKVSVLAGDTPFQVMQKVSPWAGKSFIEED